VGLDRLDCCLLAAALGSLGIAKVVRTAKIAELEDDRHIGLEVPVRRPRRELSILAA